MIVSVALLVLLMCSKPPRPGSAEVGIDHSQDLSLVAPAEKVVPESLSADTGDDLQPIRASGPLPDTLPEAGEDEATLRQSAPRVATVDARNCDRLDYGDIMYGQVTVRWVWNGTKFVPHKVCVVEEEGGVSSVWSFDQQEDAVLSELVEKPDSDR